MFQLIGFVCLGLSLLVGQVLRNKFKKYSATRLHIGLTGKEVAEKMLRDNNIYDVQVTCVEGMLTDHYNPLVKTVNLSREVYENSSVAAAAVAAHECGHAVQHAKGYAFLKFRTAMVPVTSIASKYMPWVIFIGFMTIRTMPMLLEIGIVMFALTTLFTFVTLPVEFDASRRALNWIRGYRIVDDAEYSNARDALKWAALTYVIAALGSLAQLLHLILMASNRRKD
jgi:Zn-dependent membrane protease YugP